MKTTKSTSARQFNLLVTEALAAEAAHASLVYTGKSEEAEALELASTRRKAAYAALKAAMEAAPWGQNGAVFITRRQIYVASQRWQQTLWVNDRPRAVLYNSGWVEVFTPQEGEEMRARAREDNQADHAAYQEERKLLIQALHEEGQTTLADFGEWSYYEGQEGGTFSRGASASGKLFTIGAPGAMRAAWGKGWDTDEGISYTC
ncbi:MAG: hypothetical protein KAZ30_00185 [Candidatus Magasanikbacteria bacterium]|nr:hypothetical protein [Candidatus Magasanikbacteria bacterium]